MAAPINNWSFQLKDDQVITKIMIRHGFIVDGIGFEITGSVGKTVEWFTGSGGSLSEIPLSVGEKITHISGSTGTYYEEICITTIKIYTTLRPEGYGPYGEARAANNVTPFSTPLALDGSIVGFLGSNGQYLNSIGIYNARNIIKEHGPFGNKESGQKWQIELNDGERFSKVFIKHGFIVDGIGFEVSSPTGKISTQMFSGPGGDTSEIDLDEKEYMTQVSGEYGKYFNQDIRIASITIYTNLKVYGPYGRGEQVTEAKPFSTPVPLEGTTIFGFNGSYGTYLNSIGLSDKYKKVDTYGPFGRA
ncbi:mannose/glucose-specific lectin-like [Chenopodium quinoa]|uniref:mannose/glucose-specific lectin-like n=1 Tax=Chenopodium quinoa TaxID=63459 RepID=UPI000B7854DF|nr:mannose/glucose-specific lectin-like [Chenopodium quinoa]